MRYFKYVNTDKTLNNALKEQYKALTADEKRTFRKKKAWEKTAFGCSLTIFILLAAIGIYLIKLIPQPGWWPWKILVSTGMFFVIFANLIFSGLATYGLTFPLWKKAASFDIPAMKKEIFSKACAHLRRYYKLQEPYIVTKCFDATNKCFKNHDVCIFVVDDELRMTANLIKGFLYGKRDLGCYAFKKEEIILSKIQDGKHLVLELKAGKNTFLLGYRAKQFIEKNFIGK